MKGSKIEISYNKTLRLKNVLIKEVILNQTEEIDKVIIRMDNYLRNRGAKPIGPIVQYTNIELNEINEPRMKVKLLRQSNLFLHNTDRDYEMESLIRVKNCLYARYNETESNLKFAYDKINLIAFEEDIRLKGDSYTVFVSQEDGRVSADIFMERANNE